MNQTTEVKKESTQGRILGNLNTLVEILIHLGCRQITNLISTCKNINKNKKDDIVIDILERAYLIQNYGKINKESWLEAIWYGEDYDLFTKFIDTTKIEDLWDNQRRKVIRAMNEYGANYEYEEYPDSRITIPGSVEEIGKFSFAANEIIELNIGDNVKEIDEGAFSYNKLTSLLIPDSVKKIGQLAFEKNPLKSVTIGDNVEKICGSAFYGNKLDRVDVPDKVKKINQLAFSNNELKVVNIGKYVETIGSYAFSCNQLEKVTIPNSVKTIDEGAFFKNHLIQVNLGNNVEIIGEEAFDSNDLTEITIPYSVKKIEQMAFTNNNQNLRVIIPDPNPDLEISDYAFDENVNIIRN